MGYGGPGGSLTYNQRRRQGQLDELDVQIIATLQIDGRTSNSEMARNFEVSEATIRNRVARLLEEDLINIRAVPTPRAVGMTMSAIIGVSVRLSQLDEVVSQLADCSEVRYVGVATGRHDIMIEAFFTDQSHLLDFVSHRLGGMKGVTRIETSLILKVAKFSYEWEVPTSAMKRSAE